MIATALAIVGTLLGAVVTGLFQHAAAGRAEAAARGEQRRAAQGDAIEALAVAVSRHRIAMVRRAEAAEAGDPAARVRELETRSHETRSDITPALIALRLHVTDPATRRAADGMIEKTFAMRGEYPDRAASIRARAAAMDAHDRFVDVSAEYLQLQHA